MPPVGEATMKEKNMIRNLYSCLPCRFTAYCKKRKKYHCPLCQKLLPGRRVDVPFEVESGVLGVGDKVSPKTPAGLWLSAVPCNGRKDQASTPTIAFRGQGTIVAVNDIVIDYDAWDDQGLGVIPYRNCLVRCNAGEGWAGEEALISWKN